LEDILLAAVGAEPDQSHAAEVHRRTGGNPLFVEALGTGHRPAPLADSTTYHHTRRDPLRTLKCGCSARR